LSLDDRPPDPSVSIKKGMNLLERGMKKSDREEPLFCVLMRKDLISQALKAL
jgi:hypothetical protein